MDARNEELAFLGAIAAAVAVAVVADAVVVVAGSAYESKRGLWSERS